MPLISGGGKPAFKANVKETMDSYKKKGTIGTSTPPDKKAALKQALAIAYSKMRESK